MMNTVKLYISMGTISIFIYIFVILKNPALWLYTIVFEIISTQPLAFPHTPIPWEDLSTHLKVLVFQLEFVGW